MPGVAFHITARAQNREPWFVDGIRDEVERIIIRGVTTSDAMLLSHIVMPNHFHIVARQGQRTLGWVMQPIMRRIALLVQRRFGVEGHVFERRFRSFACENADRLRRAVIYTSLNAWRCGLCTDPAAWAYGSHTRLIACATSDIPERHVLETLKLFAHESTNDWAELVAAYLACLRWRMEKDAHTAAGIPYDVPEPPTDSGDRHFVTSFCALPALSLRPRTDLRDKAIELLEEMGLDDAVNMLRRRRLNRHLTSVRRQLIAGLLQHGYRVKQIADFLRLSDSAVSLVASQMRYAGAA
jgi:REP element-mobilizing transposase RayT